MWKITSSISLVFCLCVIADDAQPEATVSVECYGRIRHGVVSIGGETTGTTMTSNRVTWELQLLNDADRKFADEYNKKFVVAAGTLRKKAGIETEPRWIIDVSDLSQTVAATPVEGTRMTIQGTLCQGTLRSTALRAGDAPTMTIESDGQVWPLDFASNATLKSSAESLVGQPVLLTGRLQQVAENDLAQQDFEAPGSIRIKTIKRSLNEPVEAQCE